MARNTKAEREAEAQSHCELREKMARDAYPALLMDTLARATNLSFNLCVRDSKFVVSDCNDYENFWTLTYDYTPDADSDLGMLWWEVEWQEHAIAEANRKIQARQAALAKLSAEGARPAGILTV